MEHSSEEELYNVEEILDKRVKGDKVYYFIKWENYPGQDSWEPVENLNDMAMVIYIYIYIYTSIKLAEFEQKLTEKNVIQAKNSKSSSIITERAEESKKLSIKEPKNVEKMKKNRVSIDEDNGECLMNDVSENLSKVMRAQIEIQRAKPIDRIVGVRYIFI